MIRKFYTSIRNGKLVDDSGVMTRWLSGRKDGECLITVAIGVDATDPKRSSKQNRYYHGVVVAQYLQAMLNTGDSTVEEVSRELQTETLADALHELFKFRFAGREVVNYDTEIGVFWDKIRADCLERYGVEIPPPPDGVFDENEITT